MISIEPITHEPPELYEKQEEAILWTRERDGSIIHFGMACGKSRVIVELINISFSGMCTCLIFAPKKVIEQGHWGKEFERYSTRALRVHELLKGSMAKRLALLDAALRTPGSVVVINYEALQNKDCIALVRKLRPTFLIYDEIQRIKAPMGKRSKGAHKLVGYAANTIGLTGTMLPHSPLDAFGIMRAIDPNILGWSFVRFRARYSIMGGWGNKQVLAFQNQDELARQISRVAIKATREEMLDLPPVTHIKIPVKLSVKGKRAYDTMEASMISEFEDGVLTAVNGLVKLLRLMQITSGLIKTDDGTKVQVDDGKKEALRELLLQAGGEPVVIFGRFHADLDNAIAVCEEEKITYSEVSGRSSDLAAWSEGETQVLIGQIQAVCEGVDLTRAAIGIFMSIGHSLGTYDQALARLDRPTQTRSVVYYHLIATGTVDVAVRAACESKRKIVQCVFDHWTQHQEERSA